MFSKVLDPFAQNQPISGKLHKFADSRIEDIHDQQPCLEENQPISENSMNISTCSTSNKVKTYLQEICASCEKTGSRPDFIALSEELRKATDENGHKLFTTEEWLNPPQIKGYIANIISKSKSSLAVKKPRAQLQEVNVDDDEKLSEVVAMLQMNDFNANAVGIVNEVFSAVNI
ncbi:unnamed protein product [Mytilus coruscus]|uniref:Uncharacterized protein n=1 Tax=Mytilus coruscus TaxID=42192 RepID=A0A6J8BUC4_MYTCO|nr:unnamed protein product [Mytilus coruscus]